MSNRVSPKYLTKSRFKLAYECPTKLWYHEQPTVYGNKNNDNEFLKALAHGGFQVGALAKFYYPGGIDLEGLKSEEAITQTEALLKQENITIFEAAIQTGPFLVRVDVLEKKGNAVSLIEVKSKSFNSTEENDFFLTRKQGLEAKWEPYFIDVAFQTWVTKRAHPEWSLRSFLMMPDKSTRASVDGLHQHFRIFSPDRRTKKVITSPDLKSEHLGTPVLNRLSADREVDYILNQAVFPNGGGLTSYAEFLSEHHQSQSKAPPRPSSLCKACEFRGEDLFKEQNLKDGFEECWRETGFIKPSDQDRTHVFEIWDLKNSQQFLNAGKVFFDQVVEDDLKPKTKTKKVHGLERYQRRWIQIEKRLNHDPTPYIDEDGLRALFNDVTYPIHCVDFETTTVAIPFHKGRRPYEQIAFQFSHHVLHEDGRVAHVDQYLDMRPGVFPNFDFVRRLRDSLASDQGTIFRYASHENTVLRQIRSQLINTPEPDQNELLKFIDSITKPRDGEEGVEGRRSMIDLREVVLSHYYHPLMGGSNSIKKVIPAVLEESEFLKSKYAKPIYGKGREIPSLNFTEMTWIERDSHGRVIDPYTRLPPVFSDLPQETFSDEAPLFVEDAIDDGGAAMTAWSRMQFTEMSEAERGAISAALLKYCELDTLSMIWILEYWREIV